MSVYISHANAPVDGGGRQVVDVRVVEFGLRWKPISGAKTLHSREYHAATSRDDGFSTCRIVGCQARRKVVCRFFCGNRRCERPRPTRTVVYFQ
jgi:hypothetical protein